MTLTEAFYKSFIEGRFDPKEYILSELRRNDSRLSNFLAKDFSKRTIKVNLKTLLGRGYVRLAKGKRDEWWLVLLDEIDTTKFLTNFVEPEFKYALTFANRHLAIVSIIRSSNAESNNKS